jgi:hypothetical protein
MMNLKSIAERRREERSLQTGTIYISFDDPNLVVIEAELIEASERGFRARHDSKALAAGMEVQYECNGSFGRARVMWTHVLDGRCVSGFLIPQGYPSVSAV